MQARDLHFHWPFDDERHRLFVAVPLLSFAVLLVLFFALLFGFVKRSQGRPLSYQKITYYQTSLFTNRLPLGADEAVSQYISSDEVETHLAWSSSEPLELRPSFTLQECSTALDAQSRCPSVNLQALEWKKPGAHDLGLRYSGCSGFFSRSTLPERAAASVEAYELHFFRSPDHKRFCLEWSYFSD